MNDKLSIKIFKGSVSDILEFPIRPTTSTKAVLVEFKCGAAWILTNLFQQPTYPLRRSFRGKYCLDVTLDQVPILLDEIYRNMRDELVEVKKAGKGPTEKSHKFKVEVLRRKYSENRDPNNLEYERTTKTMTLGWFGVDEVEGQFFAERKMIEEKLDKGYVLPKGRRAFGRLENQLNAAAEKVALESVHLEAEQKRRLDEYSVLQDAKRVEEQTIKAKQQAQKIGALMPVVLSEGANAIAFCKKHYALTDMQRKLKNSLFSWEKLPDAPLQPETLELIDLELLENIIKISKNKIKLPDKIIEGATVKWVDWVGTTSNRRREESECENCIVKYFGAKRVIICPDGDEITKMEGPNLQIIGGMVLQQ